MEKVVIVEISRSPPSRMVRRKVVPENIDNKLHEI